MRGVQHRSAGCLVHPAGLQANDAVLHHVDAAHAVGARQLVELRQQRRRRQRLPVDGDRRTPLETDQQLG